jgi:hypothetical protein
MLNDYIPRLQKFYEKNEELYAIVLPLVISQIRIPQGVVEVVQL